MQEQRDGGECGDEKTRKTRLLRRQLEGSYSTNMFGSGLEREVTRRCEVVATHRDGKRGGGDSGRRRERRVGIRKWRLLWAADGRARPEQTAEVARMQQNRTGRRAARSANAISDRAEQESEFRVLYFSVTLGSWHPRQQREDLCRGRHLCTAVATSRSLLGVTPY
jgi:hypothetical protein